MKLNKYFSSEEFKCKCGCGQNIINEELVDVLETLREWVGVPVYITAGNRCKEHNKSVGGKEDSKHLYGMAADIMVKGFKPRCIAHFLRKKYPEKYGIGEYDYHVHIDVRTTYARWNYS